METITLVVMIVSLLVVFAVDARQKRRKYLIEGKKRIELSSPLSPPQRRGTIRHG